MNGMNDASAHKTRWILDGLHLAIAVAAFSFSLFKWDNQVWIAAWAGPVLLLRFTRTHRWLPAALLGFAILELALGIGFLQMFARLDMQTMAGNMSSALMIEGALKAGTMVLALAFLAPFIADKVLHRRLPHAVSHLAFPSAWVTVEWLYSFNVGTLYCLGQSQAALPPLVLASSVFGMHGLSFLIAWSASMINLLWENGWNVRALHVPGLVHAGTVALTLTYGALAVVLPRRAERTAPVAGIVLDARFEERLYSSGFSFLDPKVSLAEYSAQLRSPAAHIDEVRRKTLDAVRAGAKIIVWQEYALTLDAVVADALLAEMKDLADEADVYLLVSYARLLAQDERHGKQILRNLGVLFTPEGRKAWEYAKAYPITGTEDYAVEAGARRIPHLDTPYGRIGQVICFDMHFPQYLRQAALDHIDLLFSPSVDGRAFTPMATLNHAYRAVESGFTLVRITGDGLSAVVDPSYRFWAARDTFEQGTGSLYCDVPVISRRTFYAAYGFLLPHCACLLLITLIVVASIRSARHMSGAGPVSSARSSGTADTPAQ